MRTSSSNIRRLRSGVIGSISAWLPSRRSTAHQRGATVVTFSGQGRSGSATGVNGAYLPIGMPDGRWGLRACGWFSLMGRLLLRAADSSGMRSAGAPWTRDHRGEAADLGEGLAAADKQDAAAHTATVAAGQSTSHPHGQSTV